MKSQKALARSTVEVLGNYVMNICCKIIAASDVVGREFLAVKWEDVNSSALVLLSVTFIPQKNTPLRHQGSGERQPYWQEEGGVSWEVIIYGKQGGPSLLR